MQKRRTPVGRYSLELPDGRSVTVTVTDEIAALALRVREAMEHGREPDLADVRRLTAYLSEDT